MNLENLKNRLDVALKSTDKPKDVKIFLKAEDNNGKPINIEIKSINWEESLLPTLVMTPEEKLVLKSNTFVGRKQMVYIENIIAYCILKLFLTKIHIDTVWNMYCWLKVNVNRPIDKYEIEDFKNKEDILNHLKCTNAQFVVDETTNCITTTLDNSLLVQTFGLDINFERKISEYIDTRKVRLLQNSVFYKNILAHIMDITQVKTIYYKRVIDAYQYIVDNLYNYYENYFFDIAVSEEDIERTILYSNDFFEYDDRYIYLKKDFKEMLLEFPLSEELRKVLEQFIEEKEWNK